MIKYSVVFFENDSNTHLPIKIDAKQGVFDSEEQALNYGRKVQKNTYLNSGKVIFFTIFSDRYYLSPKHLV